jgi:hypothetical protein
MTDDGSMTGHVRTISTCHNGSGSGFGCVMTERQENVDTFRGFRGYGPPT